MRGNRRRGTPNPHRSRSIPAYAGEPCMRRRYAADARVYPRVCGGTNHNPVVKKMMRGLSPRMRGNPAQSPLSWSATGSIPAYAGEPCPPTRSAQPSTVYPRVCGGTLSLRLATLYARGLSPRMRGNHLPGNVGHRYIRSIPAYAGEPTTATPPAGRGSVYPRVCGGTDAVVSAVSKPGGLSPRMRGT